MTAIASASDLPIELLLHFVAALPHEFSDFGGMDFFDGSVHTLFFPGYKSSTSFTLNAYQMSMFDFFFLMFDVFFLLGNLGSGSFVVAEKLS